MSSKRAEGWHLAGIALVGLLLVGLLAMIAVDRAMRASAMAATRAAADGDVAILAAGLESELEKFVLVPRVLAVDPEVRALLSGEARYQPVLNRRLADLAKQTGASAIYLMDADGLTRAASNWNLPTSFVGSNYRFRSYFSDALASGAGNEFALGTVSRRPGLYIGQRVQSGRSTLGVVAVKVEFDALEKSWRDAAARVFVTDHDGIVLIASDANWRFSTTRPEWNTRRNPAQDALRFGIKAPPTLRIADATPGLSRAPLIAKSPSIAPSGWELNLVVDPTPQLAAATANGRLVVVLGLVAAALLGGLYIWLSQRRERRAEAMLGERTAMLRDQLLQANRLATLGQVTAGIGHEIRQPVAAMRVLAESGERLIAQGNVTAAAGNFGKIGALTVRIGQITEELLRFSRRGAREPRAMPLAHALDGALLLLRDRIEHHGASIVGPDPDLAQTTVRAEHVRLEQVLVNVLQNALDASPPSGTITIGITLAVDRCLLTVEDEGGGLSDAVRATLFQPFATTKEDGLGLGLVIARDIMRTLGGDLRAENGPHGARFIMEVPRA